MAEEIITQEPVRPAAAEDLSAEIVRTVERLPGDDVRCTWLGDDRYRCNWWAAHIPPRSEGGMACLVVTTQRVRDSQFLRVTRVLGQLVIKGAPAKVLK